MDIKKNLLDILVCPVCKAKLKYLSETKELLCSWDKLVYPIKAGIPIMLEGEARIATLEEIERLKVV